jgi:hypothetical protein
MTRLTAAITAVRSPLGSLDGRRLAARTVQTARTLRTPSPPLRLERGTTLLQALAPSATVDVGPPSAVLRARTLRCPGGFRHPLSWRSSMRTITKGSSMLALAAVLAVGACSSGSNRDSTMGTSAGDVGGTAGAAGTTGGAMSSGTTTDTAMSGGAMGAGAAGTSTGAMDSARTGAQGDSTTRARSGTGTGTGTGPGAGTGSTNP